MNRRLRKLQRPDSFHLLSAEGWLELGNYLEANEDLERITPEMRAHPDVLKMRWRIYTAAKKPAMAAEVARGLTVLLPEQSFGWIHWAFSLHELKLTKEAQSVLLPLVDKFTTEHILSYNLACYACQLGELKEAKEWLIKAIAKAGKKDIRIMALDDPDLEPLWKEIGTI